MAVRVVLDVRAVQDIAERQTSTVLNSTTPRATLEGEGHPSRPEAHGDLSIRRGWKLDVETTRLAAPAGAI
ncbi:MAG: hypothetical protein ACRDZ3_15655, partial [Acidimicrobiia bacterium]